MSEQKISLGNAGPLVIENCYMECGCGSPWPDSKKPCPKCGQAPIQVYTSQSPELTRLRSIESAARDVDRWAWALDESQEQEFEKALKALRLALGKGE